MAEKLLRDLGSESKELSVLITDDAEIKELNSKYRNKNEATDVLSFSLSEGEESGLPQELIDKQLGDVVISVETAQAQAKEDSRDIKEWFLELLVHGLLHLHGYEHEGVDEDVSRKMFDKQAQLLAGL